MRNLNKRLEAIAALDNETKRLGKIWKDKEILMDSSRKEGLDSLIFLENKKEFRKAWDDLAIVCRKRMRFNK